MKKTILVTGSTDGIGEATARGLLPRGAEVIIHGRDHEKGKEVLQSLEMSSYGNEAAFLVADLSVQESIRKLVDEVSLKYGRLDVLINNAGVYMPERQLTPDGVETTLAVNYLAPFLLTHLPLPMISESGERGKMRKSLNKFTPGEGPLQSEPS